MTAAVKMELDDIFEGAEASFEEVVTSEMLEAFATFSGDFNPLHTQVEYAKRLGLRARVAHGAIQQALISRLVGMSLPGEKALITGVSTDYVGKIFEGDTVIVKGKVTRWDPTQPIGQLTVSVLVGDQVRSISQVKFTLQGAAPQSSSKKRPSHLKVVPSTSHPEVFFLGARSSLAQAVQEGLSAKGFHVTGVGRRDCDVTIDFETGDLSELVDALSDKAAYGVVLFASQAPKKSSVANLSLDALFENLSIHLRPLQSIAKAILEGKLPTVKRIIIIGSSGARHLFPQNGYEGYSYTKMLSSFFAKDLVRDLAGLGVTVNIIAPSELACGMSGGLSSKMQAVLSSMNPTGQLVSVADVGAALELLLSENSQGINGQEIVLSGGRVL